MIRLDSMRISLCFASFLASQRKQNINKGMIVQMCHLQTYWHKYLHFWNWGLTPSPDLIGTWKYPKMTYNWPKMVLPVKKCELVLNSKQHWQGYDLSMQFFRIYQLERARGYDFTWLSNMILKNLVISNQLILFISKNHNVILPLSWVYVKINPRN